MARTIRIAIVGVGNCASSLLQGIEYYRDVHDEEGLQLVGLMHYELGGFTPADIETACAFDVDVRKAGRRVGEAAFAKPTNPARIWLDLPRSDVSVQQGPVAERRAR